MPTWCSSDLVRMFLELLQHCFNLSWNLIKLSLSCTVHNDIIHLLWYYTIQVVLSLRVWESLIPLGIRSKVFPEFDLFCLVFCDVTSFSFHFFVFMGKYEINENRITSCFPSSPEERINKWLCTVCTCKIKRNLDFCKL